MGVGMAVMAAWKGMAMGMAVGMGLRAGMRMRDAQGSAGPLSGISSEARTFLQPGSF